MKTKNLLTSWVIMAATALLFSANTFAQNSGGGYSLNEYICDSVAFCDSIPPMYVYELN